MINPAYHFLFAIARSCHLKYSVSLFENVNAIKYKIQADMLPEKHLVTDIYDNLHVVSSLSQDQKFSRSRKFDIRRNRRERDKLIPVVVEH